LFAVSGESLTLRLRARIFRTLLQQDVAYFDQPENNTGALCTRLATEASAVQGVGFKHFVSLLNENCFVFIQATGIRIGTILQNVANLGVGIALAFYFGWQLTLLMLAFVPFMIIAGFLQTYMMTGFADKVCFDLNSYSDNQSIVCRIKVHWKMLERFEI
jgi:ATP-binding cassette subfamily B (MDR/TAP) protein 1